VKRYRGKVTYYEVWNEADGEWCWKHGVNGKEYGSFVIDTAKAIREGNPDAKVVGGAVCGVDFDWLSDVFQTGAGKYMDAFSYHGYASDECHSADP